MRKFILIIMIVFNTYYLFSQYGYWEEIKVPSGWDVEEILLSKKGTIYRKYGGPPLTRVDFVKSTDNGKSWEEIKHINSMSIFKKYLDSNGNLFITDNFTIWFTPDEGTSWRALDSLLNKDEKSKQKFLFPTKQGVFMFVSDSGLYKLADDYKSWKKIKGNNYYFNRRIFYFVAPTANLYFAISGWGLIKSTDEGKTWQDVIYNYSAWPENLFIGNNDELIFTANNEFYISKDYGITWDSIYTQGHQFQKFGDLQIDAMNNLYAQDTETQIIYKSSNLGSTWEHFYSSKICPNYKTLYNIQGSNIILYDGNDFIISFDYGNNWTEMKTPNYYHSQFIVVPSKTNDYTLIWVPAGLYLTRDFGMTFENILPACQSGYIYGMVNPDNNHIIINSNYDIWHSSDLGNTWKFYNYRMTYLDNNSKNELYGNYNGISKSIDYGKSWKQINGNLPVKTGQDFPVINSLCVLDDALIVYLPDSLIWFSEDDGTTWHKSKIDGPPIGRITKFIKSQNFILALQSSSDSLRWFRSIDKGKTWTTMKSFRFNDNIMNVDKYGDLFKLELVDDEFHLIKSTDKGDSWFLVDPYAPLGPILAISDNGMIWVDIGGVLMRSKRSFSSLFESQCTDKITTYPNPFSQSTTINYELQTAERVKIEIFNSLGSKITTLVDEWQDAGRHSVPFSIGAIIELPIQSGIYFYRIQIGDRFESGKLLFVK